MKKILLFVITLLTLTINVMSFKTEAYGYLDYIHEYQIKVDPREDGTLDMQVYLKWEVLDSTSEGPLSWIRVGVPNCYVDEFRPLSSSIKKIKYMYDSGSSVIRVDLRENYYKGDIVEIKFAYHLSRMYMLSTNYVHYDYLTGWFDEIVVKDLKVLWNKNNVLTSNQDDIEGEYLVWYGKNVQPKGTINVHLSYKDTAFNNLDPSLQYTDQAMTKGMKMIVAAVIAGILTIIIVVIVVSYKQRDPYLNHRGFCVTYRWYHFHGHRRYRPNSGVNKKGHVIINPTSVSSGGHSSGSSCACACACACAGGGRAGCSRKDFYNTKIYTDKIIKRIK